jgi:multiple sugar transport system substrate-binding protein
VVDLTKTVQQPGFGWNDFVPGERAVATVGGKVLGVPALVDNLAVVYNKDLFRQHHLAVPAGNWTWSQLAADARAISDPAHKIFGLTFPADGSETTVWEYEAMLWEAGGSILSPDNSKAAFNSPAGVRALQTLRSMQQQHSLYLDFHPDAGQSENLFNSGKIGMIITGPWDLSSFPDVHYGVQYMPSFSPGGSHQTISGPDNWVVFNNGPARVQASIEFLRFLTQPANLLKNSMATGDLPTRASVVKLPGFPQFNKKYPGAGLFAANLANVRQARPQIAQYPRVSAALGREIVAALLGQTSPQAALNSAAQQADGYLAAPG